MATDELTARRQRLEQLRKQGFDPYPSTIKRSHSIKEVREQFGELQKKVETITVCGRIMAIRKHGGSTFFTVRDDAHNLQVYCKRDVIGQDAYTSLETLDGGDFLEITGTLFVTHAGEQTVLAKIAPRIIAKALRPLPEKWHGLSDVETRYRKRYLDLLMNESVRVVHERRTEISSLIRKFLEERGFTEVETPILQQIPGGATAQPFMTHLNALDLDLYLRIAPELYLKRLLVGGFTKIFEIARCFRNEGIDHAHNPEFTNVELYQAYIDYRDLMRLVEELMADLVSKLTGSLEFNFEKYHLDFTPPYAVKDWMLVLEEILGETIEHMTDDSLRLVLIEHGVELETADGYGAMLDKAYKKLVRPNIIQPTFLIDHPIRLSPLAKRHKDKPNRAERFQLVLGGGIELVNGFSELNDPLDQRSRFDEQERLRQAGDKEAQRIDEDFLECLEYGMPPAAGLGLGLDRLAALLTNNHSLKEVILFPTLRPKS
ncbi:lysine--tRNA ligase [Candidatus Uhrbacteria bacterium RIFCSPHIGHO2_02_FULL_47_29]|uniref:Lysine--tRNA ligase n=1 Tax=Candidatus Uhrbacteria bacterium RIFCSPLOWO2_01_FULL_47_25 TaxID=1802402 RepID=A0A1F7UXJ9_9BACT|nr:MAG: Lysine-tRNA ligase [Parcubacteria group bacterium GW2011_GWA2_46_9]OGL60693.1 MAG: lysine--tRNA ligase [Candidatus Uhrbacteria bacterium RIFCSPHIGHO2_01_FULL_46_23]OGL70324.1 MAG: lysine--tRNA ligase [Candidatus Uhrbacteria bacterium RIFCSPHIGHO2_02_FULL_47_29]OGL83011.1 MAG: lysine--tRNA ligase [Candidatus Uhrbacteria bacterium RIFCSPLOWO2_01_FULL_47_25]OGL84457.1 MAG: lysine--tRNA ligase [Candidatus Uhrbacteria bacterium RIFCSPLOWO2_02_FULL_46_19]